MAQNDPTTSPFARDKKIRTGNNSVLNTSPFIETEATDVEDVVSPFGRGSRGTNNSILNTSPFGGKVGQEEITISRAYYELQEEQTIKDGSSIDLQGPLQIIPIRGTSTSIVNEINDLPFGNVNIELGSTVTLYGTSDTMLVKMSNSRDKDYGVWLNGAVTFYNGYSIQLQLVTLGTLKIWLQISKNF